MSKSIIEDRYAHECYECGMTRNLDTHHIFGGARRTKSEDYGLKVHLCVNHHTHPEYGVHGNNKELKKKLQQLAQKTFEEKYSHELFMQEFGKNYLD